MSNKTTNPPPPHGQQRTEEYKALHFRQANQSMVLQLSLTWKVLALNGYGDQVLHPAGASVNSV